ncbi:hypothetical protein Q3G72_035236 [Acer saccharum]|nr:hypothetical protein Q3G72_035236 [Acer saccharum]
MQASNNSQSGSQATFKGAAQDKDANGLPGIPYLSTAKMKATVHVSSGSSGSSRDQSEDDDATTDNIDLADAKPVQSADIRQKYNEAVVKNRVLKADVETLKAKMKMAEESIKRIAGLNPMFHAAMLELSTMKDGAVPVQDDPNHHIFQPPSDDPLYTQDPIVNNDLADISSADNVQPNSEDWLAAWSTYRSGFIGE